MTQHEEFVADPTDTSADAASVDDANDANDADGAEATSAQVGAEGSDQGGANQGGANEAGADVSDSGTRSKRLEAEGDIAGDFLEDLLDIADLDGDIDLDVDGNRAAVSIVGAELSELVGKDGEVLEALQELTRLAVLRETGERSRLMLDVGGHRAARRQELVELAQQVVKEVKDTGDSVKLEPMSPFERKVVHDAVAGAGLQSESDGVEPRRCVVVLPSS